MRESCSTQYDETVAAAPQQEKSGLEGVPPELLEAMKEFAIYYRKRHPKASQREVKRATARQFNVKLKKK